MFDRRPPANFAEAITVFLISCLYTLPCWGQGAPERPPRGFVVSLGLSDQPRVFRTEAAHAARVLSAYYGRGGATRVRPTKESPAIPQVFVLASILAQTAARMDKQRDVLIVFLTSHGSPDGIAIQSGRSISTLAPNELRAILDRTGVERKVLIVSACHSGIFTTLANYKTAVITASDAFSASFGCTATANLTYFGLAFLIGSIPDTPTLSAAFQSTLPFIKQLEDARCSGDEKISAAQRKRLVEKGECFRRSNPQMAGGWEFIDTWRAANVSAAVKTEIQDVFPR
jgi:hypothetical protein